MGKFSKKAYQGGETPDWMDVLACIRALDGIHLGVTMVTILPEGTGSTGGMKIAISTSWEPAPGAPDMSCVITERLCTDHRVEGLPAFVLGGLYEHDYAIGAAYQQRRLPEA